MNYNKPSGNNVDNIYIQLESVLELENNINQIDMVDSVTVNSY